MSLPSAAEDIGLELGILLPTEGPPVVGQRKPQGQQQLEMLPFLFPETGTMVCCSWFTSESSFSFTPHSWQLHNFHLPLAHDVQFWLGPCIVQGRAASWQQTHIYMTAVGCVQG